jgi:hypothetical protein
MTGFALGWHGAVFPPLHRNGQPVKRGCGENSAIAVDKPVDDAKTLDFWALFCRLAKPHEIGGKIMSNLENVIFQYVDWLKCVKIVLMPMRHALLRCSMTISAAVENCDALCPDIGAAFAFCCIAARAKTPQIRGFARRPAS